jgi:hypothetical protein
MPAQSQRRPQLTKQQLAQSRVIAKGTKIRDVQRLVGEYGGIARNWVKKSSPPFFFEGRLVEVHWYEHHGLGRFEERVKQLD